MLGERLARFWVPAAGTALTALALMAIPAWTGADRAYARAKGSISQDVVALTVDRDGTVHVRELVTVQAGAPVRTITTRVRHDDGDDRVFRVEDVRVTGAGAAGVSVGDEVTSIELRGTGQRTYTITYDVVGAVSRDAGSAEVRWIAVGAWDVPVESASVAVAGPAPLDHVACLAGPAGSARPCTSASMSHTREKGRFAELNLRPGMGLTAVAGFPDDAVAANSIVVPRRTLASAFTVSWLTGGVLLLLLAVLFAGVVLLYWTRGRDARTVGAAGGGRLAPLRRTDDGQVTFAPPDGVRPGQVGTLIDEQADVVDVTATVVDLAVRNYLFVEELPRARFASTDWRLVRRNPAGDELLPYERELYDALFAGRDSVRLSELGDGFASSLGRVRERLYEDVVRQGWFVRRPDVVRGRWTALGGAMTLAGVALTVVLAFLTQVALVGLAVVIGGAALVVGGQFMPAKTAKGSAAHARTAGLREYMRDADAADVPDEQRVEIFSRHLPYALVFDAVERWARVVASVAPGQGEEPPDSLYWYAGPAGWDLSNFGDSMRTFALHASGAISSSRIFRSL